MESLREAWRIADAHYAAMVSRYGENAQITRLAAVNMAQRAADLVRAEMQDQQPKGLTT